MLKSILREEWEMEAREAYKREKVDDAALF
jgi:hypothetical protein